MSDSKLAAIETTRIVRLPVICGKHAQLEQHDAIVVVVLNPGARADDGTALEVRYELGDFMALCGAVTEGILGLAGVDVPRRRR